MEEGRMKVGDVARRTGLTVRTLHHWEDMGLLDPAGRTPSGHRFYGSRELKRLHTILALRNAGLGLSEIRSYLHGSTPALDEVLRTQRRRVKEQIQRLQALDRRLRRIQNAARQGRTITEDDLLDTMEMMMTIDKHFTPEQLKTLEARREELGPEAIRAAEEEWPRLIARVREEMESGTDPADPKMQKLATRWKELIEAFSGGDEGIESSLASMYREEPQMARERGMDPELFGYVGAAMREVDES